MTSEEPITIYVPLLGEDIEVWRPVLAVACENRYTIISKNTDCDGKHWQFAEGDTVYCKPHTFVDGRQGLAAYANAEP